MLLNFYSYRCKYFEFKGPQPIADYVSSLDCQVTYYTQTSHLLFAGQPVWTL